MRRARASEQLRHQDPAHQSNHQYLGCRVRTKRLRSHALGIGQLSGPTTPLDPEQATSLGLSSLQQQNLQSQLGLAGKFASGATYDLSASDTRTSGTLNSNFVYTGTTSVVVDPAAAEEFRIRREHGGHPHRAQEPRHRRTEFCQPGDHQHHRREQRLLRVGVCDRGLQSQTGRPQPRQAVAR